MPGDLTPARTSESKKVSFYDFHGILAPVFSCFRNDENLSLDVSNIRKYAIWLKSKHIIGVLVNSVTGEGPNLGLAERKLNAEKWFAVCKEINLIMIVQIGGAPLPDVLELAAHAEKIGIDAVLCLPELFFKPTTIEEVVKYCNVVAKKCRTRPFFYYHIPRFTGVDFPMNEFCNLAEDVIPTFFGLYYASPDLDMAIRCIQPGRVLMLGYSTLIASAIILGFETVMVNACNIRPDLCWQIYSSIKKNDITNALQHQLTLNQLIQKKIPNLNSYAYLKGAKNWFNEEMFKENGARFSAGPIRRNE